MSIPTDQDNPFAPPAAAVLEAAPDGSTRFVPDGRAVAPGRGFAWFGEAWELFKRAPGTWIAMFVVFAIAWIVISLIPLGGLVVSACYPIIAAGLMLGCRALEQGKPLELGHLFAGFGAHSGNLLVVGLLYLAGLMLIGFFVGIGSAIAVPLMVGTAKAATGVAGVMAMAPAFVVVFLVALALMLPLIMALWFAPAIVVFNGTGSMAAMRSSFRGCMKNFVPFLLYGLAGMLFAVIAALPLGLGYLVLGPVLWATMYAGYRDIFEPRD
jgi:hypothetical protein